MEKEQIIKLIGKKDLYGFNEIEFVVKQLKADHNQEFNRLKYEWEVQKQVIKQLQQELDKANKLIVEITSYIVDPDMIIEEKWSAIKIALRIGEQPDEAEGNNI